MKLSVAVFFLFTSAYLLTGCVNYTTLQTANTLKPGQIMAGAGAGVVISGHGVGVMPQLDARAGIVDHFDIGAKYQVPSLFFVDGKVQLMSEPFALSADLGWSHYSYSGNTGTSKGKVTGWYPMLIFGKEHWYAGVKGNYFSSEAEFEFFGMQKFKGSGWASTNIIVGGMIGSTVRLLPELNVLITPNSGIILVPALGLQFVP